MTAEELNEFITDVGIDRVVADLIKRGYYVKPLATSAQVPDDKVSTGAIRMLDSLGLPLAGHGVTVETVRTALPVVGLDDESYHIGESQSTRYYELNADGVLLLKLIKGAHVIITVSGGFSRELVVPNEDFDVLTYSADDGFVNPAGPVTLPIRRV